MEVPQENASSSSSSVLSIDKSDTNQSMEEQKNTGKESKDAKKGEASLRNFSGISRMRDMSAMDINEKDEVSSHEKKEVNNVIELDDDYDLAELNSEVLSKQMSNVVTQLEKQVLDDSEKKLCYTSNKKPLNPVIDLTKNIDTNDGNSNSNDATFTDSDVVNKAEDTVDGIESQDTSQGSKFNDIHIKVIDVPEDDDLFDFLKQPGEDGGINKHPDEIDETSNYSDTQHKQVGGIIILKIYLSDLLSQYSQSHIY